MHGRSLSDNEAVPTPTTIRFHQTRTAVFFIADTTRFFSDHRGSARFFKPRAAAGDSERSYFNSIIFLTELDAPA
jgi:hypothetical protein